MSGPNFGMAADAVEDKGASPSAIVAETRESVFYTFPPTVSSECITDSDDHIFGIVLPPNDPDLPTDHMFSTPLPPPYIEPKPVEFPLPAPNLGGGAAPPTVNLLPSPYLVCAAPPDTPVSQPMFSPNNASGTAPDTPVSLTPLPPHSVGGGGAPNMPTPLPSPYFYYAAAETPVSEPPLPPPSLGGAVPQVQVDSNVSTQKNPEGSAPAGNQSTTPAGQHLALQVTGAGSSSNTRLRRLPGYGPLRNEPAPGSEQITPYCILVPAGQDITGIIMSVFLQGTHMISIASAVGVISKAALIDTFSGSIHTYEGRFHIYTLFGSFSVREDGGEQFRMGILTISMSGSRRRVITGRVGGPLISASPVQILLIAIPRRFLSGTPRRLSSAHS
ncbi:AT-hook motif nuclear-localized protein [Quillaja saponaria]|uniref:AT-hook motif nuclear-localized protein n=1 Tax=Quillaja saponaria TaxID=32244 RepID=A0AAD7P6R9_QUISA|nr:AT-hook motif nuclear-localized protein [Quillaja saponaria]